MCVEFLPELLQLCSQKRPDLLIKIHLQFRGEEKKITDLKCRKIVLQGLDRINYDANGDVTELTQFTRTLLDNHKGKAALKDLCSDLIKQEVLDQTALPKLIDQEVDALARRRDDEEYYLSREEQFYLE